MTVPTTTPSGEATLENSVTEPPVVDPPANEDPAGDPPADEDPAGDPPVDEGKQDDPAWLRKQLTEVRNEAAARRVAQREAEEALSKAKSPEEYEAAVKDFTSKIEALEREITVRDIAASLKIPADLTPLLTGSTEEEIRASAELLKQHVVRTPAINENSLGGGLNGTTPPATELDPGALARQSPRR